MMTRLLDPTLAFRCTQPVLTSNPNMAAPTHTSPRVCSVAASGDSSPTRGHMFFTPQQWSTTLKLYVGKGIPFLLTFNIKQHLGSDEAFFCRSWKSRGSAVLLRPPLFWVLELLTAVGRTKPRLRPVGENGSRSGLIIRVYTLFSRWPY